MVSSKPRHAIILHRIYIPNGRYFLKIKKLNHHKLSINQKVKFSALIHPNLHPNHPAITIIPPVQILTSSVLAAVVLVSMRLVKLVLLPCRLLRLRQPPTSASSPEAIRASRSFSRHCASEMPNTRPPLDSARRESERERECEEFDSCGRSLAVSYQTPMGIYGWEG